MNNSTGSCESIENENISPIRPNRRRKPTKTPEGPPEPKKLQESGKNNMADIESLKSLIMDIRKEQQAIRQSLEKRIDNIKEDIHNVVQTELRALRQDMTMEISTLTNRITNVEERLSGLEDSKDNKEFSVDTTCVGLNLRYDDDEDISKKCKELASSSFSFSFFYCQRIELCYVFFGYLLISIYYFFILKYCTFRPRDVRDCFINARFSFFSI